MTKLVKDIDDAIRASGLKNGMTISFHHHLRNGDFVLNMVMDRIAACKVYQGAKYRNDSPIKYLDSSREKWLMCDQLRQQLSFLLTMLAEEGEDKTFHYIKTKLLKGHPFPWETEE